MAQEGGGVYAALGSVIRVTNSTIAHNEAATRGGGIFGKFDIADNIFDNSSAIRVLDASNVTNNVAKEVRGHKTRSADLISFKKPSASVWIQRRVTVAPFVNNQP